MSTVSGKGRWRIRKWIDKHRVKTGHIMHLFQGGLKQRSLRGDIKAMTQRVRHQFCRAPLGKHMTPGERGPHVGAMSLYDATTTLPGRQVLLRMRPQGWVGSQESREEASTGLASVGTWPGGFLTGVPCYCPFLIVEAGSGVLCIL